MSLILAIDTATQAIGIALHDGSTLLAECTWQGGRYHTVELAPEIALILRRVKRSVSDLTAVAVARGPGSYTGLRIGMALAKGLALAHRLPLLGLSTFDVLASAQPLQSTDMLAVIRAGRSRIGVCAYKQVDGAWNVSGEPYNTTWQELIERIEEPVYICGEVHLESLLDLGENDLISFASPPNSLRRPGWLAELAWQYVRSGKITDAAALAPEYLNPRGESAL